MKEQSSGGLLDLVTFLEGKKKGIFLLLLDKKYVGGCSGVELCVLFLTTYSC
jgi:hypothetical protein